MASRQTTPTRVRSVKGFTLMEVLIALGIFGVGMVAVATIFPVAISLQKQTIAEVEAQQVGRNAKAMMQTSLTAAEIASLTADEVVALSTPLWDRLTPQQRAYLVNDFSSADDAKYFWIPLSYNQQTPTVSQQAIVFIVQRQSRVSDYTPVVAPLSEADSNATTADSVKIPVVARYNADRLAAFQYQIANADTLLGVGDPIVDSNGTTHRVIEITGNIVKVNGDIIPAGAVTRPVWFAPRPSASTRTCIDVIQLVWP